MKHSLIVFVLLIASVCLNAVAQERRPHFSKEEFRAKQKEYMIRKAELTNDEADKFFVLYFELQDKKKKINDSVGRVIQETKKMSSHETNYGEIIDKIVNANLESDKLERSYIAKYRKFLSDKKIFKILVAERNFHRELLKSMKQEKEKAMPKKK